MERQRLITLIREVLGQDRRVVFAYVYGSFVTGTSFRDIDIGVYVRDTQEDPFSISSEIKAELSHLAKKENLGLTADQFDIQLINHAPFTLLKRVFKEGTLLVDNDPVLRSDLIEHVSLKYRECAGLLAEVSLT